MVGAGMLRRLAAPRRRVEYAARNCDLPCGHRTLRLCVLFGAGPRFSDAGAARDDAATGVVAARRRGPHIGRSFLPHALRGIRARRAADRHIHARSVPAPDRFGATEPVHRRELQHRCKHDDRDGARPQSGVRAARARRAREAHNQTPAPEARGEAPPSRGSAASSCLLAVPTAGRFQPIPVPLAVPPVAPALPAS
jgi:hypothetical protein